MSIKYICQLERLGYERVLTISWINGHKYQLRHAIGEDTTGRKNFEDWKVVPIYWTKLDNV